MLSRWVKDCQDMDRFVPLTSEYVRCLDVSGMERNLSGARPHVQLLRVVLQDLIDGSSKAGERLPREQDLARQFGVSRGLVRQAMRGLEDRGVVSVRQGRGTVVLDPSQWNVLDEDVLAALLGSYSGLDVLGEFIESRHILEVEAAGLAADRAGPEHLSHGHALVRMGAAAQRAERSPAAEDLWHEADVEFHETVIAATGNRVLARMVLPVHRALIAARRPLAHPELRVDSSLQEHKAILTAIASRDALAARHAMTQHLETVAAHLQAHVSSLQPARTPPVEATE